MTFGRATAVEAAGVDAVKDRVRGMEIADAVRRTEAAGRSADRLANRDATPEAMIGVRGYGALQQFSCFGFSGV